MDQKQHESMIDLYNYETSKQSRTFDYYNDVDSWVYNDIHDHFKFIKHGYIKALDHACREIRFSRLSRNKGLELVKKFININPKNVNKFLDW